MLITAQFGRIITTDRPEAITVLANANCRSVERISRSNGEDEEKLFEEDKILMPSLKLVLGGTSFEDVTQGRYRR